MKEANNEQIKELACLPTEEIQSKLDALKKGKSRKVKKQRRLLESILSQEICLWRSQDGRTIIQRSPKNNGKPFELIHTMLIREELRHTFEFFPDAKDITEWLCD